MEHDAEESAAVARRGELARETREGTAAIKGDLGELLHQADHRSSAMATIDRVFEEARKERIRSYEAPRPCRHHEE